jgi:hypothetical protein
MSVAHYERYLRMDNEMTMAIRRCGCTNWMGELMYVVDTEKRMWEDEADEERRQDELAQ